MSVTDVYGHGGLTLGGAAETEFVHGPQVDSDVVLLWDFDGDGDFDEDVEDITGYLYEAESFTGRDWPSQLQGKAGPGRLRIRLRNDDDRFSYFNEASPLNQNGNSLDVGRKIRIQVDGVSDVDPVLLMRDRFTGSGSAITTDELGTAWQHLSAVPFVHIDDTASLFSGTPAEGLMVIDVGTADYFVQMTVAELGDNVLAAAGVQENNDVRLIYRWQDTDNYSYLRYGPGDGLQVHTIEAVNVVAGTPSTIYGPFADVSAGGAGVDAEGDHRQRVTIGVHAVDDEAHFYVNGCRRTTVAQTAIQTDETHVGIYVYYGVTNDRPAIDEIAVWDTVPAETEGVLWTGHVVDVFPETTPGGPKTVSVEAEGVLAQVAQADVQPQAWAGRMSTGVALGDGVERAGLLYPPGTLAIGDAEAGSSSDATINALSHARKFEEVEVGFLHEAPEGWLVYRDRSYRSGLSTAATFSDAPGAQFSYQRFEMLQWRRELINKVSAGVSYGAPNLVVVGGGSNGGTASGAPQSIGFTFPTAGNIEDGDLFVVIVVSTVANNNENWLVPLWWVRERDTGASSSKRTQVYTHIAAASEAGTPVTFYNDAASAGGSFITSYYQIRDWFGSHEGIHVGEWAVGEAFAGADPVAVLPPWGDVNPSVLIAQRAGVSTGGAGSISNPTYPLGYVNSADVFQNGTGSNIHDAGLLVCSKLAMTALDDPSSFTGFTGLNNAETSVIAVRGRNGSPQETRGRLRVTVEDKDSQRRHNAVASYEGTDLFPDEDTAEEWCQLMLTAYARPLPIVRLSFTATVSQAYRAQAYKRRLGDKVHVVASNGSGMGIDRDFHIESIAHRWSEAGKLWEVTWELSPA